MNKIGWSAAPLESVAIITMGQSPPTGTVNEDGHGLPFIQGNAEFGARNPLPVKFCLRPQKQAQPGDILLSVRAPVGALNLADQPLSIGRGLSAITAADVDATFLWHALQHAVAGLVRVSQGSTFTAVNRADLCGLEVPLPPAAEQRKIAAILSSIDDAIETTWAVIDQVQVVKRGLMQELLTRGLPGRHTRFKQTEIGKIPYSWELSPLEHFVASGPDNGLYRPQRDYGDGTPIIRIDAFDNGDRLRSPQLRRVALEPQDVARFAVKPGDILINRVNSLTHLAKCALVMSFDEPTVYESNMMRLCLNGSRLTTEFGFMWLSSEHVKADLRAKAKRAVAQASVNQNDVLTVPTPCPPHAEQQHITRVIGEVDQRLELESDTLERLRDAKSALSSALLTGVLRVSPDPADA